VIQTKEKKKGRRWKGRKGSSGGETISSVIHIGKVGAKGKKCGRVEVEKEEERTRTVSLGRDKSKLHQIAMGPFICEGRAVGRRKLIRS